MASAAAVVGSAVISSRASSKATSAQTAAAATGQQLSQQQFEETQRLLQQRFETVQQGLDPFIQGGQPAFQQQQALSGALGPEAQAAAFQQFQESPGTQFLREQGLRLVDTGAAATGGLGGGQRLRELTQFSQGLALQNLDRQFGQLGAVSGAGLQAAQALGGVSGQAGATQANLASQSSALQAGLLGQAGAAQAAGALSQAQIFSQGIQQLSAL